MCSCTAIDNDVNRMTSDEAALLQQQNDSLRQLGIELRQNGDFFKALATQSEAIGLSMRLHDTLSIVKDYNQLGTTFRRLGRMEQAIHYHYQALGYAQQCSDTSTDATKNLVVSLNGLGNVHLTLGNNDMAEACFRQALAGETRLGSALGMAINYANLGSIKTDSHELDSALIYYNKSLHCNEEAHSDVGLALCHNYIGNIYQMQDSLKAAEHEYLIAAGIVKDNPDRWHSIEPMLSLGENMYLQRRYTESQVYLDSCLAVANELHSFEHLASANRLLASLCEATGHLREALDYQRQCEAWSDSVINSQNDRRIRELCIEFEQQKTQHDLEALQKAYDTNEEMHQIVSRSELALLIVAAIALILLYYASRNRKLRIQTLNQLSSMRISFFRNITHEFRTPLTVMLGLADQLKDDTLPQPQRLQYIDSIKHQGHTLLELVNQLLSLSKLMTGFDQRQWRHGDIVAYLRLQLANYTDYARMRDIRLTFEAVPEHIEMDFVPTYYDKILSNLLGNAFKYTPQGCDVTLRLESRENHLVLDVIDTGQGIAPEDMSHIFELFFQGKKANAQGSTGIGLPFVKQMVQQMGGIIDARNCDPHGTCIHIVVSQHCSEEDVQIVPWTVSDYFEETSRSDKPYTPVAVTQQAISTSGTDDSEALPTILVVEDNSDISGYLQLLLEPQYHVVKSFDGYDAMQKASTELPDIILTDVMMPGMDGYELCSAIRKSEVISDVPVIIITARAEESDRVHGYDSGADAYLLKPFNPQELQALITRLLSQRSAHKERLKQLISGNVQSIATEVNAPASQPADMMADTNGDIDFDIRHYLAQLKNIVQEQMLDGDLQLDTIARRMNTSRSTLARRIKLVTGVAPSTYILQLRLNHACELLSTTQLSIGEISLSCGFDDMSYFCRLFRKNYDKTPSQYRSIKAD